MNCWAKNLRDAVLCFNFLDESEETFFDNILQTLKTDSLQLETLELFSCNTVTSVSDYYDNEEEKIVTSLNNVSRELEGLTSIRELIV